MASNSAARFPKRFLWGAAIAAHQSEGGLHNQWTVWELENAKALSVAAEYHYGDLDSWDVTKRLAKLPANYISGKAVDHRHRYKEDFDLARELNLNALRFSVEWSRIEPEEGVWDAEAIAYYKDYIAALHARGLEPVMTLFHFTLPVWFAQKGGFEKRRNVRYFVQFAEKLMSELGGSVKYIVTINEPEAYAFESYMNAHWPPASTSFWRAFRVYRNLAYAHNQVYRVLHRMRRTYKISFAKHSIYMYPGDDAWVTRLSAAVGQWLFDDYWIRKTIRRADYLGVNWYVSQRVYGYRIHNPEDKLNDLGWPMDPAHLEHVLDRLYHKYKKPILITENGVADANDQYRKWWLGESMRAMQRALGAGVELLGYMHWTLTDNFEWDKGRWPRFGLYAVDYRTLTRTPRASALWWAQVIKKVTKG
jgi:beta-glucosidase